MQSSKQFEIKSSLTYIIQIFVAPSEAFPSSLHRTVRREGRQEERPYSEVRTEGLNDTSKIHILECVQSTGYSGKHLPHYGS